MSLYICISIYSVMSFDEFAEVAKTAARAGGDLLLRSSPKVVGSHYSELNPVTRQDKEAELEVVHVIKQSFPNHSFLGEELGRRGSASEYVWIIDPIDGTNNFVAGRDTYSVSIGLEHKGKIIVAAVYLPARDEMFTSNLGKGSHLNGRRVHVSTTSSLSSASITFSVFPGQENEYTNAMNQVKEGLPNATIFGFASEESADSTFGRGSMAAELCYVACGRIDGLIRLGQKPWDVAGGSLIVSEAGAELLDLKGYPADVYKGDYIVANPVLAKQLFELVRK